MMRRVSIRVAEKSSIALTRSPTLPRLSILMNRFRFMSTGAPTDVSPWSFGAGTRSDTFVLSPFRGDGAEWAQG